MEEIRKEISTPKKPGRIYFTKQTERKVFFILTLLMLVYGIFAKMGYF